ncbi:hypothetical protein H4R20_002884, partial [Coemansia guatemalensis]
QAKFSEERVKYGVDEPSSAHYQMPMFTLPNSNTMARQVLFDDSANNCLSMVHCGVQLASPAENVRFLQDAKLLSSIKLASFFTALQLDPEVHDIWCYQNGPHACLRTMRMVQGNSESPAIAQAFLE